MAIDIIIQRFENITLPGPNREPNTRGWGNLFQKASQGVTMGGAPGESINHDVEIPQTSGDHWVGYVSRGLIILAAEVIRAIGVIWCNMETMVRLPGALDISVCDHVKL
jgi:hypothetical protein